jgi:bacteriocin biosynthesis cyclodehydratase domain-containing protein
MTPVVSEEPQERRVDFAVAIGRWVLDPPAYGFWLRRDIPHLPVIYGERGVTVGPTVTPGRTACLYCLERHRQDADEAWPAIASQLWGRPVRTETSLVASDVALRVTRIVAARLAGGAAATSAAVHLDAATGHVVQREWMPHPDCGCVRVPAAGKKVSGSRRGIDSPAGTAAGSHLRQPRTVPAAAARE